MISEVLVMIAPFFGLSCFKSNKIFELRGINEVNMLVLD